MKIFLATLATVATVLLFSSAFAAPPGKVLEFSDSPMGTVVFSGKIHKDAGVACAECHNNEMFPKYKQGSIDITMEDIYAGRLCGVCHNGKRAFAPAGNCNRCHIQK